MIAAPLSHEKENRETGSNGSVGSEEQPSLSHESTTQWVVLVDNASEGRRYETMGTVTKGRPLEGAEHTTQIACRLPDSMLAQLDAWRAERTQPGLTITRSDALRMILAATLDRTTGR